MQLVLHYAYQKARDTLGDVQRRQKMLYDRKVHGPSYKEGDKVLLYSTVVPPFSHRKLYHPWTGPYQVISKLSNKIAPIADLSKTSIVHFDRLKLCPPDARFSFPPFLHSPFSQPPSSYHVGDNATLFYHSDDIAQEIVDNTPEEETASPPHRYPARHRRSWSIYILLNAGRISRKEGVV